MWGYSHHVVCLSVNLLICQSVCISFLKHYLKTVKYFSSKLGTCHTRGWSGAFCYYGSWGICHLLMEFVLIWKTPLCKCQIVFTYLKFNIYFSWINCNSLKKIIENEFSINGEHVLRQSFACMNNLSEQITIRFIYERVNVVLICSQQYSNPIMASDHAPGQDNKSRSHIVFLMTLFSFSWYDQQLGHILLWSSQGEMEFDGVMDGVSAWSDWKSLD